MKKKDRDLVYEMFSGRCTYCGDKLQKGWHVDHREPIVRNWWNGTCENPQNEHIDNYTPSCPSCNILKGSESVERLREKIKQFVNSLNQYSTQYKFAKRYGLVEETEKEVIFYFETLSRQ